jgi:hypothetical protein
MTKMEMGQSYHDEFWTIGLNVHGRDCRLPRTPLRWRTFYPLADTKFFQRRARPSVSRFTTIGQWYWGGAVEVNGTFPDLSKKFAFEPYLDLPKRIREARFELAMNIAADDPDRARLERRGWQIVDPHRVARTPGSYRRYMAGALAEFTAIKGVDVAWRTGWLSDRAARFLLWQAGCYGRHRCGKISAVGERAPFCPRDGGSGRSNQRGASGLATTLKPGAGVRGGNLRFCKKSSEDSGSLRDRNPPGETPSRPIAEMAVLRKKALDLALQNDFRVLLVVPLWLT